MDNIISKIKKERSVKLTTLKTYQVGIKKIFDMFNDGTITDNFDFLKDAKKIMDILNNEKLTTRKNRVGLILVLLGLDKDKYEKAIEEYREIAKKLRTEHDDFINKQEKTDKQEANWIDYKEYIKLLNKYRRIFKNHNLIDAKVISKKQYQMLQEYIFLTMYKEYPIRNVYSSIKVIEESDYDEIREEHKGNWLVLRNGVPYEIIIHDYKTESKYGMKTIKLNKKRAIVNALKVWLKHNKSGHLFTQLNDREKPYNTNAFTRFVQGIFEKEYGKKIGTTLLRNIIISHEKQNEPTIQEKEQKKQEIEDKYLHSSEMNDKYRKK